eukprot:COSAG06_NODE_6924_length_2713_cov_16.993879_2_plen_706_part_01
MPPPQAPAGCTLPPWLCPYSLHRPSLVLTCVHHCPQTLMDFVKKRKRLTEPEAQFYMMQLLDGMVYMHGKNVIHRDLKLGNLFLDEHMNLKIGDFGLAAQILYDGERKKTICGTPNYIVPEILSGNAGHSFEVDIWAYGVIMYTLLVGKPPFETTDVKLTYRQIKANSYTFPDRMVGRDARDLITRILHPSPDSRPTLPMIRRHNFFQKGGIPKAVPSSALYSVPHFRDEDLLKPGEPLPTSNQHASSSRPGAEAYERHATKPLSSRDANDYPAHSVAVAVNAAVAHAGRMSVEVVARAEAPVPDPSNLRVLDHHKKKRIKHIEQRAVTYAFVRRLTDKRLTQETKAQCVVATIEYYESLKQRSPQQQRDLDNCKTALAEGRPSVTGRDFHRCVIKADTHHLLCRYAELEGCGDALDTDGGFSVGVADAFVSWNWDSDWEALLSSLEAHTAMVVENGGRAPHYWLDIFAVNQHTAMHPWACTHPTTEDLRTELRSCSLSSIETRAARSGAASADIEKARADGAHERSTVEKEMIELVIKMEMNQPGCIQCPGCAAVGEDMMSLEETKEGRTDKGFERVINSDGCRELLVFLEPWFAPRPVTRVWCLYEMLLAIRAGKPLATLSPPAEKERLKMQIQDDVDSVQRAIDAICSRNASATMPEDRTKIFAAIRHMLPGGFDELDRMIKEKVKEWTYGVATDVIDRDSFH